VSVGASDQEMKPEIKKAKSLTVAKTTILYGKISEWILPFGLCCHVSNLKIG